MKIIVGNNITKTDRLIGLIQIIVHCGITKNVRSIKIAVDGSATKNICSRLCAWKGKNVDTSSQPTHDSPFFMLQRYWQQDDELSLSEELQ